MEVPKLAERMELVKESTPRRLILRLYRQANWRTVIFWGNFDYLTALYTMPEWASAFGEDPTGKKGTLTAIRVRACELTGLLKQIVYLDLVGLDDAQAKERLLNDIKPGRGKPDSPPVFRKMP